MRKMNKGKRSVKGGMTVKGKRKGGKRSKWEGKGGERIGIEGNRKGVKEQMEEEKGKVSVN